MDVAQAELHKPRFRRIVSTELRPSQVDITAGGLACSFEFEDHERAAVALLISCLERGGGTPSDLASQVPEIASKLPALLREFDRLRLLTESDDAPQEGACTTGLQLYREVRRIADRVAVRVARSLFYDSLLESKATRAQLIGYALEYYWIVRAAPGLIAPALATAQSREEQALMQDFLRSELGHDKLLERALTAVGVTPPELDTHQPLPTTFALGASLGVYARQHPLSFKSCLFLFERPQEAFLDAFESRCRELRLPSNFYAPLREHSDINSDYDHEDISRQFLQLETVVEAEAAVVTKRHVALMVETMVLQEEDILWHYGRQTDPIDRNLD